MRLAAAIDQLAPQQGGCIARWQLRALGAADHEITALLRGLDARPVRDGVWTTAVAARGSPEVWAAVLAATCWDDRAAAGRPAAVPEVAAVAAGSVGATAFTAAFHRSLIPAPPARTQLLVPHRLVKRIPGVQAIRSRVPPGGVELADGTPCVDAIRMLYDCSRLLDGQADGVVRARDLMCRADGLRHAQAAHLWMAAVAPHLFGLPGRLSRTFAVAALSLAKGHSHSGSEHRGRQVVQEVAGRYGLDVIPRPYEVRDHSGRRIAEADIAIPEIRYDCEIDGPHHLEPEQRARDARRDSRMRRIAWSVDRYPSGLVWVDERRVREGVDAGLRQAAARCGVVLRHR